MKRRIFAMAMACALSLTLLASCGGDKPGSSSVSASGSVSGSISGSSSQDGSASTSTPDQDGSASTSTPDASAPDASTPDGDLSELPEVPQEPALTLSKTDFSLFKTGTTWKLKASGVPEGSTVTWTSSDDAVATVAEDGTVTYVSAGSVTITATAGDLTAACKVYCKPEKTPETPDEGDSSDASNSGSSSSAAQNVDLAAFYTTVSSNYELGGFLQQADKDLLDSLYPGMSDVATEQCLVYATMMSMNMGEFALIQVKDSKDVDTVKSILQTRIDNMANGGAWYPEPTRVWTECSKIVTNGNYIMMVVNEEYQSIVDEFNALF